MQQQRRSSGRLQPITTNNPHEDLSGSLNQLSIGTSAASSRVRTSPQQTPSHPASRPVDRRSSRHDPPPQSPLRRVPAPRRTPSSNSLKDDRRASNASLHKKASVSSLRSPGPNNLGGGTSNSPRPSLSRKSSSNLLNSPSALGRPTTPSVAGDMPPPTPAPTAASIASEHFGKEIALHQVADLQSKTVVIIQDSCYGHRYSRPRTSKAGLDQIVERPERMHAGVLGLSTAYVRMGKRHEGGRCAPHPDLDLQSLPTPPFQIRKTARSVPLSSPPVTHVHGVKWMDELKEMCDAAESRLALNGKELVRPGSSSGRDDGSGDRPPKLHQGDLYLCPESLNALEGALGGVCEAVDYVFGPGSPCKAFACIRPPGHHCSSDYPSGFCWLNNVHVGIAHAAMTHGLTHAAILDFDLHHGDGSQAITWDRNWKATTASKNASNHKKTAIGYFSLHDINSYPCEDGDEDKVRNASVCIDNAHGQSIWNVHLEPWKTTQEFWELYNAKYAVLIEKARAFLRFHTQRLHGSPNGPRPKAAIFLSAGFDASEWEGAGMQRHKVNVPTDFYARFTADVVRLSQEEGLGVDGRVISVLEGGYSDRALTSGILSHLSGLADTHGNTLAEHTDDQGSRLASEMFNRLGLSDEHSPSSPRGPTLEDCVGFDTEWWKLPMLEELEAQSRPAPPTPVRKTRDKNVPTFTAPTQASVAKAVVPTRRSSAYHQNFDDVVYTPHPIPAVNWATAAYELSKALIPTDRRTLSCQHSELKGEGNRSRQQRLSANAADLQRTTSDRGHMQLRERKPKAAPVPEEGSRIDDPRPESRHARRTTIASVSDLPDPAAAENSESPRDIELTVASSSRRVSVASSVATSASAAKANSTTQRKPRETAAARRPSKDPAPPSRPVTSQGSKAADKKSRPALGARAATSTACRSSPRKPTSTPSSSRNTATRSENQSRSSSANGKDNDDQGVDNLTQGVKKMSIKLRMPTPEEHAAKIKASEEAIKKTNKPSRKTQATKPAKKTVPKDSAVGAGPSEGLSQDSAGIANGEQSRYTPEAASARSGDSSQAVTEAAGNTNGLLSEHSINAPNDRDNTNDTTIPSPPLTPQSAESRGAAQPEQISPSAPNPRPGTNKLPVFTSTSVIPFAPPSAATNVDAPKTADAE